MHIFLVGFMAAGKSTVAKLLGDRLGLPAYDLDEEIERRTGMSVGEIFSNEGEAGFRARERETLLAQLAQPPHILATGGGTPCEGDAMERLRQRGLVIALDVPLEVARRRAASSATARPLLAQAPAEVAALYAARRETYRAAHAVLPAERSPERLCDDIVALLRTPANPHAIESALSHATFVALGDRSYPVVVRSGALDQLGFFSRVALGGSVARIALVSDSNVAPLYGAVATRSLEAVGFDVALVEVPAGETTKSIESFESLQEFLVTAGLDRTSAIVALGGGVVGDLAGFAAATLFRGVPILHVPTTLVAMVDSAIGGKTGINLRAGKNLVGAFHQPRLVLCDPQVLATLPLRERRAAFGELFKYGLLSGEPLTLAIEALADAFTADPPTASASDLESVIRQSVAIKAAIVAADELEAPSVASSAPDSPPASASAAASTGRALLNLGHTVGHAIEASAGYGSLLHGEAVALGLLASCRVSAALGLCPADLESRVRASIAHAGLDTDLAPWLTSEVIAHTASDKKRAGSKVRFVALKDIGQPHILSLELSRLEQILAVDPPL